MVRDFQASEWQLSRQNCDQGASTVAKALALHEADMRSIPDTTYVPLSTVEGDPKITTKK